MALDKKLRAMVERERVKEQTAVLIVAIMAALAANSSTSGADAYTPPAQRGIAVFDNEQGREWAVDLQGRRLVGAATAIADPSPDATMIAYETRRGNRSRIRIRLHRVAGGPDTTIAAFVRPKAANWGGPYEQMLWSPDGRALVVSELGVARSCPPASSIPLSIIFLDGARRRLVRPIRFAPRSPGTALINEPLAWSPDSHFLLYEQSEMNSVSDPEECYGTIESRLLLLNVTTGRTRSLAQLAGRATEASISPDGHAVLYIDGDLHSGVPWLVDVDGSHRHRVGSAPTEQGAFSPDGRQVALLERYGGAGHLVVERDNGSGRRQILQRAHESPASTIIWLPSWQLITTLDGHLVIARAAGESRLSETLRHLRASACSASIVPTSSKLLVVSASKCASARRHASERHAALIIISPTSGTKSMVTVPRPRGGSTLDHLELGR